jgi:hypothetical protein
MSEHPDPPIQQSARRISNRGSLSIPTPSEVPKVIVIFKKRDIEQALAKAVIWNRGTV